MIWIKNGRISECGSVYDISRDCWISNPSESQIRYCGWEVFTPPEEEENIDEE